jgi:hypothetical protein
MKSFSTKANWYANEATVNLKILERTVPTVNGESPFLSFDGATMAAYRYPSKASEVVFCRRDPVPAACNGGHGFDMERSQIPISALEVKPSSLGKNAGRGVFAKQDIPRLSYVGLERLVHTVYIEPSTYDIIYSWMEEDHWTYSGYWGEILDTYTHGYGHLFSHRVSLFVF